MRDLMNDLPDSFSGGGIAPRRGGDERLLIRNLVHALDDSPISLGVSDSQLEIVPVSRRIAEALLELHDYEQSATDTSNKRHLLGLSHVGSYGGPATIPWKAAHDFFQAHTHVRTSSAKKLPSKAEVSHHINVVNNALNLKTGQYFATKSRLQNLLKEANSHDGETGFTTPSDELVSTALSNLGDTGLRFVFFNDLDNPKWVGPLSTKGEFATSAKPIEAGVFSQWPEGNYLRRMAASAPKDVCEAFHGVDNWDNPLVIMAALGALANMHSNAAIELLDLLEQAARNDYWRDSYVWDANAVLSAISPALADSGLLQKAGVNLARQCLMPKPPDNAHYYDDISACVPSYQYSMFISSVIESFKPTKAFGFVNGLIEEYDSALKISGRSKLGWLIPSIQYIISAERPSIGNDLVRTMTEVLRNQLLHHPGVFILSLGANSSTIIKRIALHVLSEEYKRNPYEAPKSVKDLVSFAVNSDFVLDQNCDPEYFPLVHLAIDNGIDTSELWKTLQVSIAINEEEAIRELDAQGVDKTDAHKEAASIAVYRQHRILSLIKEKRLPSQLRESLSELNKRFGAKQLDDIRIIEAEWTNGDAPLSLEEMKALDPTALIKRLEKSRRATQETGNRASFWRSVQTLTDLVCENPFFFDDINLVIKTNRPEFLNSALLGWTNALTRGSDIPLHEALLLCRHVIGSEAQMPKEVDEAIELERTALSLLGSLPNTSTYQGRLGDWTDEAISTLVVCATNNPADLQEEQRLRQTGWDEMTIAANTLQSDAIRAVIDWIGETDNTSTLEKAKRLLERHLPSQSASAANAAVFGQQIAKLQFGKHDLFKCMAPLIYGDSNPNEAQKVALSVTLAAYRPLAQLFELLIKPMITALEIGATTYPTGWFAENGNVESRIGIWLFTAYIHDAIDDGDEMFQKWDTLSQTTSKRMALQRVCQETGSRNDLKPNVLERITCLCDHYIDMAEDLDNPLMPPYAIMHLALNGNFDKNWWVPRLAKTMKAAPDVDVLSMMDQQLLELSRDDPRSALDILMSGVKDTSKGGLEAYMAQQLAPTILANALESKDISLEKLAETCMDKLGFLGIVDLDERTEQARANWRKQRANDEWA
ncbi:MAG: hypothetical protein Q4D23_03330 [Bacteroidales bacterium]|nr:hypothetical protein [Bacteroidales bacterium]